jgi:predicted ATP-grasp superfamily ATP-dependent carboligase
MLLKSEVTNLSNTSAALIIGLTIQGLAIARALNKSGVKVYAIDRRVDVPAVRSKYLHFIQRESIEPDYLTQALLDCRAEIPFENVVIFPCSDKSVRAVADNWCYLKDDYLLSWSDCTSLTASFTFKETIYKHAALSEVYFPKAKFICCADDVENLGDLNYPLLVKPDQPPGTFKTRFISCKDQFITLINEHATSLPFIAQEWIDGGDDRLQFCTVFLDQGKVLASVTGRKFRSFPPSMGRGTVIELFEDAEVREKTLAYLHGLVLSGPVSVEFKRDNQGTLWLIEPNMGRTEYCVDLIIHGGLNLPLLEYYFTLGLPCDEVAMMPVDHDIVWYDTEVEPLCFWASCLRQMSFSPWKKRPVFPYLGHGDSATLKVAYLRLITGTYVRYCKWLGRRLRRLVPQK